MTTEQPPLRHAPPPIIKEALKLPEGHPIRFLLIYGACRIRRQEIQRAILNQDGPRRFDEQWQTRTL